MLDEKLSKKQKNILRMINGWIGYFNGNLRFFIDRSLSLSTVLPMTIFRL